MDKLSSLIANLRDFRLEIDDDEVYDSVRKTGGSAEMISSSAMPSRGMPSISERKRSVPTPRRSSVYQNSTNRKYTVLPDTESEPEGPENKPDRKKSISKFLTKHITKLTEVSEPNGDDMDLSFLRYRPEGLQYLIENTKFSKKEIQLMYRGFKQCCPSGIVSLEQFREIYAQFFPQGDPGQYAVYIFNTFDSDGNGQISFGEFVVGLSVLSRGTMEEKLRWVFRLWDVDGDGVLGPNDVAQVVAGVYELMGPATQPPIAPDTVQAHIDYVTHKLDRNGCGISLEEFMDVCNQN